MSAAVRVALVGAGWIAENAYVPALQRQSALTVIGVHDRSRERAARVASMLGWPARAVDFDECVSPAVDAAIVSTPPFARADHLRELLAAGTHVLCEKPVARSFAEIDRLRAMPSVETLLMGSATTRLRSDVRCLLNWVRRGNLGRVRRVELSWRRERGVPQPGSWRTDVALCPLGVLEDLGPHLLDVAASLSGGIGGEAARVRAATLDCRYGTPSYDAGWFRSMSSSSTALQSYCGPDVARATLDLPGAFTIDLDVCWAGSRAGDASAIRIEGTRGVASLDGLFGFSKSSRAGAPTCAIEADGEPKMQRRFASGPIGQHRAFEESVRVFAGFCRGERKPVAPLRDIVRVAAWMDAIGAAAARQRRSRVLAPHSKAGAYA